MARRKLEKPYKGILATRPPEYSGDAELWKKEILVPKLRALMEHYGIDPNSDVKKWYLLAVKLAFDHVPGFMPSRRKGRRVAEHTVFRDADLFETLREAELAGKSVKNAARQLTVKNPWFKGANPGTLRDRYYLLKDRRSVEAQRLQDYTAAMQEMMKGQLKWETATADLSEEDWQRLMEGQKVEFKLLEKEGLKPNWERGVKLLMMKNGRPMTQVLLTPQK